MKEIIITFVTDNGEEAKIRCAGVTEKEWTEDHVDLSDNSQEAARCFSSLLRAGDAEAAAIQRMFEAAESLVSPHIVFDDRFICG